jgi:hypothetical protein
MTASKRLTTLERILTTPGLPGRHTMSCLAFWPRPLLACLTPLILLSTGCGGGGGEGAPAETPRFTLGGSISGLAASGLVLANGSDTLAVDAGATGFTLPTAVLGGSSFSLTVQAQPTGQTCSVANGSGTVGNANVNNAVVTCSVNAFTVGGSISGLDGSGLVLANGSDTLAVGAGDTSFTLPTAVAFGSSFSVVVQTQPTGQTCAVTGGSGTLGNAAVTDVAVSCGTNSFALGGSITGLASPGLVLANGSDTLAVDANAAGFTLPGAVAFGSPFNVTVQAQPIGLTCSVAGGIGTMDVAPVSSVAVTCSPNAFTLGGSISGLVSGGLVLAHGNDTLAVGANATSFTLPTAVAFGSAFNVAVLTQPTGLTCTVADGSGTMGAANVGGVRVTCSANAFTLGGSISGLTRSGLVLANGSDTLAVAANATSFTLPTAVAFGSGFNVTVQGRADGQTCTVANGSGTMGAGNVASVAVSCGAATFSVSTFAGSGAGGSNDGSATVARFKSPRGVAVDGNGLVYVADADNNRIRRISPAGVVSTFAGSSATGGADGDASVASFNRPRSVAVDANGTVYVADQDNHKIRKISAAGVVSTLAGSGLRGSADDTGTAASFAFPYGIAVDASGNVYVGDQSNHKIRKITPDGVVSTLAGSGANGGADGNGTAASFSNPAGVAVDRDGNVYVVEIGHRVRRITAAGEVSTVAGTGTAGSADGSADGTGTAASFNQPQGIAIGRDGSLYVADSSNRKIRKITPDGVVSTLAGTGVAGSADGNVADAQFNNPQGLALDASGQLYVADNGNNKVRKIAQD